MEEKIILENQNLIYYIANKFKNYPYKEDLYQAGRLGMIEAYKNYNANMNCKFTTYAFNYIYGEMSKLVKGDKGIKVSREISKLNLKIEKAYILLSQKLMKEPTTLEVANYLEIPEYYVSEALLSNQKIKSIYDKVSDDTKALTLEEVIGSSDNTIDLIMLKDALNNLRGEDKSIIYNRYFNDYTQSETAQIVGISQVQVSRKEKKVLEKINKLITQ